jgi:cytochrome c553
MSIVKMMRVATYFSVIFGFLACASVGAAEVSMPGKVKVCATCHGADGKATISPYPNLAGQNRDYLVYALKAYKSLDRKAGFATLMQQQAAGLTEADINELAEYYSKLK